MCLTMFGTKLKQKLALLCVAKNVATLVFMLDTAGLMWSQSLLSAV